MKREYTETAKPTRYGFACGDVQRFEHPNGARATISRGACSTCYQVRGFTVDGRHCSEVARRYENARKFARAIVSSPAGESLTDWIVRVARGGC